MKTGTSLISILFAAFAFAVLIPGQTHAQVSIVTGDECRCVDENGEEIENCVCYTMPDRDALAWQFAPYGGSRARIGITLSISTSENDSRGARVQSVMEDGPADRAGIREGDLITHINGQSLLESLEDREAEDEIDLDSSIPSQRLLSLARELEPGEEVEIRFLREGVGETTTLVAEDLDDWSGNFRFYEGDWEGAWDAEAFQEQWQEQWKDRAENWKDLEGTFFSKEGNMLRFWGPGDREGNIYWHRDDTPFSVYERLGEGERPQVYSFGPESGRFGIAHGSWFGSGDYLNACPGTEGHEGAYVLGMSCLGGLQLETMNPGLGEYFGTEDGVLVADVHEDSNLGLEPGDVILKVGDREVSGVGALQRILRSYEADEEVTLQIMRQNRSETVSGTLGR